MSLEVTEEMRKRAADNIAAKPIALLLPVAEKAVREGFCPVCKEEVKLFRTELSLKEFYISGLCQACQDAVFGGGS